MPLKAELPIHITALTRGPKGLSISPDESFRVGTGNLLLPNCGIADFSLRFADITHVVHMTADVRWNLSDADALRINSEATARFLSYVKERQIRLSELFL